MDNENPIFEAIRNAAKRGADFDRTHYLYQAILLCVDVISELQTRVNVLENRVEKAASEAQLYGDGKSNSNIWNK